MSKLIDQYKAIKAKYPDAVLLFRVGDFYETFNQVAEIVAQQMGVTLQTTEDNPEIKSHASLSHFWLDRALQKLVKAGHRVAICEELETRKAGPMQRGVTDFVKPEPPPSQQRRFDF